MSENQVSEVLRRLPYGSYIVTSRAMAMRSMLWC